MGCSRDQLHHAADAFLLAVSDGELQSLPLDPNARYTENGEDTPIGAGFWLSRLQPEYARHFVDEDRCSSLSVAVLTDGASRVVLGARLLSRDARLFEIEAIVVRPSGRYFRPAGLIPSGPDVWLEPVEMSKRTSRSALMQLAEDYFQSPVEPNLLPAHASGCMCLQNGAPTGVSCGDTPGNQRFQQLRYPVIDEMLGVVTAVAWGPNRVLSMYFFKAESEEFQNIEAVGGVYTSGTGW